MGKIITPTLPHDLPQNWTDNQYVTPGGVEAGLTPQHGFNYLMTQVNNVQRAANELDDALGTFYVSPLERVSPSTVSFLTLLEYIRHLHDKGKRYIEATVSDFPDLPHTSWGFKLIATRSEGSLWDVRLIKALSCDHYVRQLYADDKWVQDDWSFLTRAQSGTLNVYGNGYAVSQIIQKDNVLFIRNYANEAAYAEIEISFEGVPKYRRVNEGVVIQEVALTGTMVPATVEE